MPRIEGLRAAIGYEVVEVLLQHYSTGRWAQCKQMAVLHLVSTAGNKGRGKRGPGEGVLWFDRGFCQHTQWKSSWCGGQSMQPMAR